MTLDLGICFHRDEPPDTVADRARFAEAAGFAEFWVIEDCFYTSGPSLAAAALTATEHIGVGIGIVPAVARNPAVTAMEFATLARLAPGRFHGGIGHGVRHWMAQMGEQPASPITLLDETIGAVRRLLAGERVSVDGRYVQLDDVALQPPPEQAPLVSAGVRGPKSLELAGRVADGLICADFAGPTYLRWARERLAAGNAGEARRQRITVFCSAAVSSNGDDAREAMAPHLAGVAAHAPVSLQMAPFFEELAQRAEVLGWLEAVRQMPKEWWTEIAPVGTPDEAAAHLELLADAGVDAAAMFPNPHGPADDTAALAQALLAQ